MTLERAGKWLAIVTACLAIFGSGAGAADVIGGRGARLASVEQKIDAYKADHDRDHDTLIRLDARTEWIFHALGGRD